MKVRYRMSNEHPPLVHWIQKLNMFTKKASSATWKTASIERRKQGQREGRPTTTRLQNKTSF